MKTKQTTFKHKGKSVSMPVKVFKSKAEMEGHYRKNALTSAKKGIGAYNKAPL